MKLKLLGAALLATVLAAPAYADINNGSGIGGNGELWLSIWDNNGTATAADDRSYTLDLGLGINSFASNASIPVAVSPQPTYTFAADALLTSFLSATTNLGNLQWNVVGLDSNSADRIFTTAGSSFSGTSMGGATSGWDLLRTATLNGQTYVGYLNATLTGPADTTANGSATFTGSDNGYAGDSTFGGNIGGGLDFYNAGGIGNTLAFWVLSEDSASGTGAIRNTKFDGYGWTLASNGTLSYGALAAPVPEAETWAMLLAGLGLVGMIARRRKVA